MSKKRNIAYTKPQEPEFLLRLKREAGYIEGPTVDTKREVLPDLSDEQEDIDEESPVVVVLKPGDLSQQEVDDLKKNQELEEATQPANLDDRIVFKAPKKREADQDEKPKKKAKSKPTNSKLLSFDEDELDD